MEKRFTEVVIDGTIYKLGGYETDDYLQTVAGYLNRKIAEMKALEGYGRLPTAQKALMIQLNAADDYFKAKKSVDRLEKDLSDKDKDLYGVKHDLVSLQMKMEEANRTILSLREDLETARRRVAELQAQLGQEQRDTGGILAGPGEGTGQMSLNLPEEDPAGARAQTGTADLPDPSQVFRPGMMQEDRSKPSEEDRDRSSEKTAQTFVPDAVKREAMMKSARENFLSSKAYGKKGRRH